MSELSDFHPGLNRRLVGQQQAEQTFLAAWQQGRCHHAWLIDGPRGVGKATLAYRIARFVLSQPPEFGQDSLFSDDPALSQPDNLGLSDPDDALFDMLATNSHQDFRYLQIPDGKTQISVEQIRDLKGFFNLTANATYRVTIIDSADDLSIQAVNALLKLLEEPPAYCLFLLVAHTPARLLPTVRSRCRRLQAKRLSYPDMRALLETLHADTQEDTMDTAIQLANGCPGLASQIIERDQVDLYKEMLECIAEPSGSRFGAIDVLADRVADRTVFADFSWLLDQFLMRSIRVKSMDTLFQPILEEEQSAWSTLSTCPTADFIQLRDQTHALCTQAGPPANLDRKSLTHSIFSLL